LAYYQEEDFQEEDFQEEDFQEEDFQEEEHEAYYQEEECNHKGHHYQEAGFCARGGGEGQEVGQEKLSIGEAASQRVWQGGGRGKEAFFYTGSVFRRPF
jgi:hypothetical protein